MTTDEWQPQALIEGVRADFDPDGTLHHDSAVEVKVNYSESIDYHFEPDTIENDDEIEELAEKYDPGDYIASDYRNGAYARLRYDVDEDGVAYLSEFKDASPNDSNWISFGFLRVVMAAQRVVENVPGVERVEDAPTTLGAYLKDGEAATIDRA